MADNSTDIVPYSDITREMDPLPSKIGFKAPPDRSEIAFPYVNLEEAVSVARAIFDRGAAPLARDQLAAVLGVSPGSGSFALKLGAARMFGLVETVDGKQQLTDLGLMALSSDDTEAQTARKDAFLQVPLYRKVWTEFRGKSLPPRPHGLEGAFVGFGVAPKQKDKARQAFEKSANFAGFFENGRDRLVEPIIKNSIAARLSALIRNDDDQPATQISSASPPSKAATDDPLIHGLLVRLPEPGEVWPHEKRARWLQILASNFEMVYLPDDAPDAAMKEITVQVHSE